MQWVHSVVLRNVEYKSNPITLLFYPIVVIHNSDNHPDLHIHNQTRCSSAVHHRILEPMSSMFRQFLSTLTCIYDLPHRLCCLDLTIYDSQRRSDYCCECPPLVLD